MNPSPIHQLFGTKQETLISPRDPAVGVKELKNNTLCKRVLKRSMFTLSLEILPFCRIKVM